MIIWLSSNPTIFDIEIARKKLKKYKKRIGWTKEDDIIGMRLYMNR